MEPMAQRWNHYWWIDKSPEDIGVIWLNGEPVAHFPYGKVAVGSPEWDAWEQRITRLFCYVLIGGGHSMNDSPEVRQLVTDLNERFGPCPTLNK